MSILSKAEQMRQKAKEKNIMEALMVGRKNPNYGYIMEDVERAAGQGYFECLTRYPVTEDVLRVLKEDGFEIGVGQRGSIIDYSSTKISWK